MMMMIKMVIIMIILLVMIRLISIMAIILNVIMLVLMRLLRSLKFINSGALYIYTASSGVSVVQSGRSTRRNISVFLQSKVGESLMGEIMSQLLFEMIHFFFFGVSHVI